MYIQDSGLNNNIRDFHSSYTSGEIEVSPDFPKLSTTEKIVHLSKVRNVFIPEEGKIFLKAIRSSKKFEPSFSYEGGKRDFYIADTLDHFEVQFDGNGKINDELISSSLYTRQSRTIKFLMIRTFERLAQELNWKNTTQCLAFNAIDYHFNKDSKEPLQWHNDGFEIPSEHSFVVLLSDPNDEETGWTGGDLLYTAGRVIDYSKTTRKDRKKIYKISNATKGEIKNEPNSPVWQISASQYDGILFGNKGMQHKVTSMSPLKNTGRRMIVTAFSFGTPETVESYKLNRPKVLD